MKPRLLSLPALVGLSLAHGGGPHRPVNHGLVGYGIKMYDPVCAFACGEVVSSNRLTCSTAARSRRHNDQPEVETSEECFATDEPYLLTLAHCLHTKCHGLAEIWDIERFWAEHATGTDPSSPDPAYTYDEALKAVQNHTDDGGKLPAVATLHGTLHAVSEVSASDWEVAYSTVSSSVYVEESHSRSGIILITAVMLIPLAVHLLRLVRLPNIWERKVVARLGHSALFGKRHAVPLPTDIGILPTRGQAAFIAAVFVLNIVLLLTGYRTTEPNLWDQTASYRWLSLLANRAGILSFANMTLMMLCCGRNNLVVRFTKWSYSTMLLYHRWIAYICIFEALIHGTIHFMHHIPYLAHKFTQAYWNIGVITVSLMLLVIPLSALPVRKRAYELFVDSHVVLSFFIFLGCYYHIYMKFQHEWGYENWIYLAVFCWVVDRIFRAVKLLGGGIRTAVITHIDSDYARIDIPGVKASGNVYLYFPGLSWRPWQNHPFSVAASVHEALPLDGAHVYEEAANDEAHEDEPQRPLLAGELADLHQHRKLKREPSSSSLASLAAGSVGSSSTEVEKLTSQDIEGPDNQRITKTPHSTGITLYIRRQRGITAKLFSCRQQTVKVLVEGPYRPLPIPNIAACPSLVCIAGGVGISAILPALRSHGLIGRSVLYWGCRSEGLVDAVDLDDLRRAGVEIHVKIGQRWDVSEIVSEESRAAVQRGDVIVLASGPNEMADAVRAAVVRANLNASHPGRGRVRLVEESFSW